jgi:hypothetical protein
MRKLVGKRLVNEFPIYDIEVKDDHCFELVNGVVAHNSMYSTAVISGGTGLMYSANQAFIITKAQEKDADGLAGWKFTINIEKSRYVKEKSKLPFTVLYNSGIQKWSSLFDLALEAGHLIKPKMGWYQIVDMETGEIFDKSYRAKDIETNDEFFTELVANKTFKQFVERKFKLSGGLTLAEDDGMIVDIDEE